MGEALIAPGRRARLRVQLRAYPAGVPTPELPAGQAVVIESLAWSGGQLRVAVVVVDAGEQRGQVAIVHASQLVLLLDEGR